MKKRLIVPIAVGVVVFMVTLIIMIHHTGNTVTAGNITMSSGNGDLSDREKACVDAGGTLVETAVMRVCMP